MKRWPRMLVAVACAAGGVLVLTGAILVPQGASANVEIDNGSAGVLTLVSHLDSGWHEQLEPGDAILWPITTMLGVAETGELSVTVEHEGLLTEHEQGLSLTLEKCEIAWTGEAPACAVGAETIIDGDLASIPSGSRFAVGEIGHGGGPYFLATLWLPAVMPTSLQGQDGVVALGFTAFGDTASVTVPNGLPRTGLDALGAAALAAGLALIGLTLARQRASTRSGGRR